MFRRFARFILTWRWPILLLMIVSIVIMTAAMFKAKIDPSVETLFSKKSPEYRYYRNYCEKYGSDSMIAIAMSTNNFFTVQNIQVLKTLTEEISKLKQVERVISLANAGDIRHKFLGVKSVPVLEGFMEDDISLEELRERVLSNELYLNNLISKDGKVANILVFLKPTGKDRESGGATIEKLNKFLKSIEGPNLKFYVAGAPIEQYEFIKLIRHDQMTFVPIIAGLLVITTFLIYRSFTCMFLSMSIVFTSLVWTLGAITFTGQELNLMTSLLGPVIMIVSVINSIYLINLFFELRPQHKSLRETVILTIEQLGVPCFLTHFTAILGFLSLAINPVPAIQSFGIFAALGTFFSYIVEVILTILLLPLLPYRMPSAATIEREHVIKRVIVEFLEKFEFRWQWWILILTVASLILAVQGMQRIEVDTNIVKQMKPDLPLAISTKFIDENLTGVYSLGFVFRKRDGLPITDYKSLAFLDRFKTYLEAQPEIAKVNSFTTLIKKINMARKGDNFEAYRIPASPKMLARYFRGLSKTKDPELWKLVSPDFKEVRLDARMRAVGTTKGALLESRVREFLELHLGKQFAYQLTGNVVLLGKMAKSLVQEQMESFGFAFFSILLVIILIFRSVKLGLLAAIPNLVPIVLVYGFMGFANIELSTPTAMISSIVLGFVVDASIQFIYRFRMEYEKYQHYIQALHHTYRNMGQSVVVSTVVLVLGFASSITASFKPTVYFGVLTSLTIFLAMICCLLVLPMCIVMFKPFGKHKLLIRKKVLNQ